MSQDPSGWWASLRHGGLLVPDWKLPEVFSEAPEPIPDDLAHVLRRHLTRVAARGDDHRQDLIDHVLEGVCGLGALSWPSSPGGSVPSPACTGWTRGPRVPDRFAHRSAAGEVLRPTMLWEGALGARLPVFVDDGVRIDAGPGRRSLAPVVEWLRRLAEPVALLTNGRQWRLVHAGPDRIAWAEWDTDLWFPGGRPGPQLMALRTLLGPRALTPSAPGEPAPLLAAIAGARGAQAELSAELGDRARWAVDLLVRACSPGIDALAPGVAPPHVYQAAIRVVMRMIVCQFAEARDLLPRDNPIYHGAYGLGGLRESLEGGSGAGSADILRHRFIAWPRVLSLFHLVHEGSRHPRLPVPGYGGALFAPGEVSSSDPTSRALAALESADHAPSDETVLDILLLIGRTPVRVRQGRTSTQMEAPVDFTHLSSEHIGMLYEGLLDFELLRAPADEPVVVLALPGEPAFPLSRLESMDDAAMQSLGRRLALPRLEANSSDGPAHARRTGGRSAPAHDHSGRGAVERAMVWARRVVSLARLELAGPVGERPHREALLDSAARALVWRVLNPGEWFLVRRGRRRSGPGPPRHLVSGSPVEEDSLRGVESGPRQPGPCQTNEAAAAVRVDPLGVSR